MNPVIENVDLGSVIFKDAQFRDELLVFTGAVTVAEGTILARNSTSGNLVPFAIGGADGAAVPLAILTYDVTAEAAGDVPVRAGESGTYRKERLIINADGDGSNITNAILDQLRVYGLVSEDVQELNIQDNQ